MLEGLMTCAPTALKTRTGVASRRPSPTRAPVVAAAAIDPANKPALRSSRFTLQGSQAQDKKKGPASSRGLLRRIEEGLPSVTVVNPNAIRIAIFWIARLPRVGAASDLVSGKMLHSPGNSPGGEVGVSVERGVSSSIGHTRPIDRVRIPDGHVHAVAAGPVITDQRRQDARRPRDGGIWVEAQRRRKRDP